MVIAQSESNSGAKNPRPSTWSRWRCVRIRSTHVARSSASARPSGRMPVPASRTTIRPVAVRTSTDVVLPPYL